MFRNNSLTRRAAMKTAAVLAASTLVLSGCSRGEDSSASNIEGNENERIAAVGLGDSDTLLALGIQPVWQQHAHRENVVINSGARFQDQGGIHKGEHAVVAAGTVVTKDVALRTIAGGVSARYLRDIGG